MSLDRSIKISLLGPLKIEVEGKSRQEVNLRRKTRGLLAFLTAQEKPRTRQELTSLFCADAQNPLATLRGLLSRLRKHLGSDAISTTGPIVSLNRRSIWIDIDQIRSDLDPAILDYYRGPFLDGFSLRGSPEFEMWLLGQRSRWQQRYEQVALNTITDQIALNQLEEALPIAQSLVESNLLLEEAHFYLMTVYHKLGRRAAVMAQYEQCRRQLAAELAVEPTAKMQALFQAVSSGFAPTPYFRPAEGNNANSKSPFSPHHIYERKLEIDAIQAAWQQVETGASRVIFITAPAGGGKSFLINHAFEFLPPNRLFSGRGYDSMRDVPYGPWVEILSTAAEFIGRQAMEKMPFYAQEQLSRLIPHFFDQFEVPKNKTASDLFFSAVAALLTLIGQPLVILIEDIQWVDRSSLALLLYLSGKTSIGPILFLLSGRTAEIANREHLLRFQSDLQRQKGTSLNHIELAPLSGEAVTLILNERQAPWMSDSSVEQLAQRIWRSTGGNPLFIREIVQNLAEYNEIPPDLPLPSSVKEVIADRLNRLQSTSRQIVEALAVFQQPAAIDLLQEISGRSEDETTHGVEAGLRWGLLKNEVDGSEVIVDFAHDLLQAAVGDQISLVRRQLLQGRIVRALIGRGAPAAMIVHHLTVIGNSELEAEYNNLAGHQSAALYAYDQAAVFFNRALDLEKRPRERVKLIKELATICIIRGNWTKAHSLLEEGLILTKNHRFNRLKGQMSGILGHLWALEGKFAQALEGATAALAISKQFGQWDELILNYTRIIQIHWRQGNYAAGLKAFERARPFFKRVESEESLLKINNNVGLIYWQQMKYDQALDKFFLALEIAQMLGLRPHMAVILGNIGNIYKDNSQYDDALKFHNEALEIDREIGNKEGISRHLGNIGNVFSDLGRLEEGLATYRKALAIDEKLGFHEGVARHLGNIGNYYKSRHQFFQAGKYYRRAFDIDIGLGHKMGLQLHSGNLGVVYFHLGRFTESWKCLLYAGEVAVDVGLHSALGRHLGLMGEVARGQGAFDTGVALCQAALRIHQSLQKNELRAWCTLWLGKLWVQKGNFEAAATCFSDATKLAGDHFPGCRYQAQAFLPRMQVAVGEITDQEGLRILNQIVIPESEDAPFIKGLIANEKALLGELGAAEQAINWFWQANENTPSFEIVERLSALGVYDIPPLPELPPLPEAILATKIDWRTLVEHAAAMTPTPPQPIHSNV